MAKASAVSKILKDVSALNTSSQLQLLQQLIRFLKRRTIKAKKRSKTSLLDLDGLGRDLWRKIDIEKYIEKERKSWH